MSLATDIADAVVAELNTGSFSQAFTARRMYLPAFDLKDMKTLHVTAVPRAIDSQAASRSLIQQDVQVDVAVQQKVDSDAQIDVLMVLVEEIGDRFRNRMLAGLNAVWIKMENNPIYSPEHLDQLQQFTSVLTLTFRVTR